jgi:hypothetical protein
VFADEIAVVEDADVRQGGEEAESRDAGDTPKAFDTANESHGIVDLFGELFRGGDHGCIVCVFGERCKPLLIERISLEVDEGDPCGLAISLCDLLVERLLVLIVHGFMIERKPLGVNKRFLFFS